MVKGERSMITNGKPTGRAMSMPTGIAVGTLTSTAITILGCFLLAKTVQNGFLKQESIGYGILFLLLLASFLGACTARGKIKRRNLMVCMLSGLIYFLLLLSITALFFGGQYNGTGVTALLILCGSATAAMTSGGKRKSRLKTKKHPYH